VHTLSITRICTRRNAHGLKQPEPERHESSWRLHQPPCYYLLHQRERKEPPLDALEDGEEEHGLSKARRPARV
jgi:hypothetical protein